MWNIKPFQQQKNRHQKIDLLYADEMNCIKWLRDNHIMSEDQLVGLKNKLPEYIPLFPARFYDYESSSEFWDVVNKKIEYVDEFSCMRWLKENGIDDSKKLEGLGNKRPKNIPRNPISSYGYRLTRVYIERFWDMVKHI